MIVIIRQTGKQPIAVTFEAIDYVSGSGGMYSIYMRSGTVLQLRDATPTFQQFVDDWNARSWGGRRT